MIKLIGYNLGCYMIVSSLRVFMHSDLNPQEYNETMMMELKAFDGKRL